MKCSRWVFAMGQSCGGTPLKKGRVVELHETHPGICRMKASARSYVWWTKMDADLQRKVRQCSPLHPWEWPHKPWVRLHLDYAGPFLGKMFVIMIDAHFPMNTST